MVSSRRRNIRMNRLLQFLLSILIIVLVNIVATRLFTRIDLTAEKRYTLSETTKELLRGVDDIVYFQIYLEGDFPAGFTRLQQATREMLDEFRAYSRNIEYEFINPSASEDPKERNDVYQLLIEKGLQPTDLQVSTKEGRQQQIIFPGAIVSYKGREMSLELLRSQLGAPSEKVLNNSLEGLEYNLASTISTLTSDKKPAIALIGGHGELGNRFVYDAAESLSESYAVERVFIDGQLNSLTRRDSISPGRIRISNRFDAIIIAKPDSAFSEKDKFLIDQYIMRGGSVLWLVDPVMASMDSLQDSESTMGIWQDLKLEDLLFNYGARLNPNLVTDLNALPIPLRTGQVGNQPQIDFFPWYFFPVITPVSDHPIVKNLNAIKTEFVSSLDTVGAPGIKKTILLKTSRHTRTLSTPVMISLSMLQQEPDQRLYQGPPEPVAVLLEGKFESNYTNRIPPLIRDNEEIDFLSEGKPAKMIVVTDGDIIKNQLHFSQNYPLPLGYDQYTGETFGNKDFILNAMNYLTDNSGLIDIRAKELKIRLLDMTKVNNQKAFWQLLNVMGPVVLILVFAVIQSYLRRRKYSGKKAVSQTAESQ